MNTMNENLPVISQKAHQEWLEKTVLVQSCSRDYEGEFDLAKREIDIPVFGHTTIHKTTFKEREFEPAPIEFRRGSTIRVTLDKGRYNNIGRLKINDIVERLSNNDSAERARITTDWAIDADEELAVACARLPKERHIDVAARGLATVNNTNILKFVDLLKNEVVTNNMAYEDFELFTSNKFTSICRDAKIQLMSNQSGETFEKGYKGTIDGLTLKEVNCAALATRNATSADVECEYAIFKAKDGIQYVVPYKDTVSYEIPANVVLGGGTGYQMIEYYDFFTLQPKRLFVVDIKYTASAQFPTYGTTGNAKVRNRENLIATFGMNK